jgi:hypothetical protein
VTNHGKYDSTDLLRIVVVHGKRVTMAQILEYDTLEEAVLANGESVCHPDDKYDPVAGSKLAVGRALQSLGRKLEKQAQGITAQADNDRMQRQASADKHNLEQLVEFPPKTEAKTEGQPKPKSNKTGPKLNREIAEDIRHSWRIGISTLALARQHGVSEQSIRNIVQNKTYVT